MAALIRTFVDIGKRHVLFEPKRSIGVTSVTRLKEIIEKKEGKTLTIDAKITPDLADSRLLKGSTTRACPLCSLGLDVKHTDVLILSQFVRSDGCVLPKRITGLCRIQQKRVQTMVAMAQKSGLMSNLTPAYSKKDPTQRYKWKRYNTYYDDSTIRWNYKNVFHRV